METPRQAFTAMLKEWHSLTDWNKAGDYFPVLINAAYGLGIDVIGGSFITIESGNSKSCIKLLNAIEERIHYLVKTTGIDKLLLVRGAIAEMTAYFENFAFGVLDSMSIFEKAREEMPESASFKELIDLRKSIDYKFDILRCKDAWSMVVARCFDSISQHFGENDRIQKMIKT